jgi:hypothetical protein
MCSKVKLACCKHVPFLNASLDSSRNELLKNFARSGQESDPDVNVGVLLLQTDLLLRPWLLPLMRVYFQLPRVISYTK